MAMPDEMKKHLMKHNIIGMVNSGMDLAEAIDMSYDLNEPLFSKRLKLKKNGAVGSGSTGGGGSKVGGGGTYGGATGM